ncbi:MAG: hypothetical protein ACI9CE_003273 [Flavobacterium sp.]|jgi:hypothetical protein
MVNSENWVVRSNYLFRLTVVVDSPFTVNFTTGYLGGQIVPLHRWKNPKALWVCQQSSGQVLHCHFDVQDALFLGLRHTIQH